MYSPPPVPAGGFFIYAPPFIFLSQAGAGRELSKQTGIRYFHSAIVTLNTFARDFVYSKKQKERTLFEDTK